jgi:hypothetical protein
VDNREKRRETLERLPRALADKVIALLEDEPALS